MSQGPIGLSIGRGPLPSASSAPHVKGADSSATAPTAAAIFWRAASACVLRGIVGCYRSTSTGDNANYATITVRQFDQAGVLKNTWSKSTQLTDGGTITTNVPWLIASGLAIQVSAGDYFDFAIAKTSSGVSVGAGNTYLDTAPL